MDQESGLTAEHIAALNEVLDKHDVPKEGRLLSVSSEAIRAMAEVGTPLQRARHISEMAFQSTGFRPRYVMIDGVTVDTQKDASIPLQCLFPTIGKKVKRRGK